MAQSSERAASDNGNGDAGSNVDFHYIKANSFHVVFADGVWGGITPRGYIGMSFFSERYPIPKKLVHETKADGTLGPETNRETKIGIIREVGVEVQMDLAMAKSFRSWLDEKITVLEQQTGMSKDAT